jgi:hypothetical protein
MVLPRMVSDNNNAIIESSIEESASHPYMKLFSIKICCRIVEGCNATSELFCFILIFSCFSGKLKTTLFFFMEASYMYVECFKNSI